MGKGDTEKQKEKGEGGVMEAANVSEKWFVILV